MRFVHLRVVRSVMALLGAALMLALCCGAAAAKTWDKLAPSPLASDADYAAFSSRPADSLGAAEFAWLSVQRDWRAQRESEATGVPSFGSLSGSTPQYAHRARSTDARFAALASKPYASLSNGELTWLVSENGAQHAAGASMTSGDKVAVGLVVAVVAGVVGAVVGAHYVIGSLFGGH